MAYQGIGTGTSPNDNTGDSLLTGAVKINSNFSELYNALGNGSTINFTQNRTITAGDGLTGGGDLSADRTLSVNNTVVRTSGTQTIGGSKTFSSGIIISSGGLTASSQTITAGTFVGNGTIPIGGIIMWSGTIANIPTGWALCDGTNSTPDLRNRFIVGAHSGVGIGTVATTGPGFDNITGTLNANYTPGNTGGETAHKLTVAELASHNHSPQNNPNKNFWIDNAPNNFQVTTSSSGVWLSYGGNITTSTGEDKYHENRPPYYALAFIMRTS
jgi:microcystin-dependent protein